MRLTFVLSIAIAVLMVSCGNSSQEQQAAQETKTLTQEQIKTMNFNELFQEVNVQDIKDIDVFTLVGQNLAILTAGTPDHYNSMVTGWGGWGLVFGKPGFFHMLRSNRYTLELMREQKKYTVTFFPEEYKEAATLFGTTSGRDSDAKMKDTTLTAVQTPEGNMSFKEAMIILDCSLAEVTTVSPDDFINDENRKFVVDAYDETGDYHKVVMSYITKAWIRK